MCISKASELEVSYSKASENTFETLFKVYLRMTLIKPILEYSLGISSLQTLLLYC